jgi:hypothetical protein
MGILTFLTNARLNGGCKWRCAIVSKCLNNSWRLRPVRYVKSADLDALMQSKVMLNGGKHDTVNLCLFAANPV